MTNTPTGASTAISRKKPPEPLRWLYARGFIQGRALDYGSGRGCFYGMTCYDPAWKPTAPTGLFDTITCIYVLNVVTLAVQRRVIAKISRLLRSGGTAYFAVRRDLPRSGRRGRGCWQRFVVLPFTSISSNSTREIYKIKKR